VLYVSPLDLCDATRDYPMLELTGVSKRYGAKEVVTQTSIRVEQGQFLSLLGPSGSGKSTLLRMIAGLIRPDTGEIRIGDDTVYDKGRDVPPEKRAIGMVFQDYALWPHMTVGQNIAFGLKIQRWPRSKILDRIVEMLQLVRLEGLQDRYPSQLSGGQQQRVALARSLAPRPRLLLLDEPLASLDTQLRHVLREELAVLLRHIGVTSVYVTHDQSEALEMSDVIVLLRDGRIEQAGSPTDLYDHPETLFVESFLGSTNALPGSVEHHDGLTAVRIGAHVLYGRPSPSLNGEGVFCIRPEAIEVVSDGVKNAMKNVVSCTLLHSGFLGGRWQHACKLEGVGNIQLFSPDALEARAGDLIRVALPPERSRILSPDRAVLASVGQVHFN